MSLVTACLVVRGYEDVDALRNFRENSVQDIIDKELEKHLIDNEELPKPISQTGPEARNYVAYIPVPINDDEEEDEYYDETEYYDDEEYDDEDEYYEDDEYYDDPPPKKKKTKKKKPSRPRKTSSRRPSSTRRRYQSDDEEDKERVPFLVPLMMVPENQVGVEKEFSFSEKPNNKNPLGVPDKESIFSNFLNTNNVNDRQQKPTGGKYVPPNRRFNNYNKPRFQGPPPRAVHDVPGPPYRGPPPRNPNLPMDDTIIHPSIHRPRFRRPPRNFRQRFNIPKQPLYTTVRTTPTPTTTTTTTTTTETTTKARPSIIVVQQPGYNQYRPNPYGYNPYHPPYGYQQPGYQQPYPIQQPAYPLPYPQPPTTTSTAPTTTTTTTTTTATTTKRSRRRKKNKKKKKPLPSYSSSLSKDQLQSLSKSQLTIVDNQLVPLSRKQEQSVFSSRLGLPAPGYQARRFKPQYAVRGRRRFPVKMPPSASPGRYPPKNLLSSQNHPRSQQGNKLDQHRRRYDTPRPADRRFDMPNIFTQSGYQYENEERPIISRPPPRHPGVNVPGVKVPPNAGNIEDIIAPKPVQNNDHKYMTQYRPPRDHSQDHHNRPPLSYKPTKYEEPPYRPGPSNVDHNHNPHHSSNYHQQQSTYESSTPQTYVTPSPYQPPPTRYYTEPPYKPTQQPHQPHRPPPQTYESFDPPQQNFDSLQKYATKPPYNLPPQTSDPYRPPAQSVEPAYRPPAYNNEQYNPPSQVLVPSSPYIPTPQTNVDSYQYNQQVFDSEEEYNSPPQYNPPPPRPSNTQGNIHDYYLTSDPQSNPQSNNYGYENNAYQPPRPPTRLPASTYNQQAPSADKRPIYNYNQQPDQSYNSPPEQPYTDYNNMQGYNNLDYNNVDKVDMLNYHPDGPDYSSGTLVHPPGSKNSAPFKVGLDLYPMGGVSPLGALGKQDIYDPPPAATYSQDDNKHQILLHLNLFSKKPSTLGGNRAQDIDLGQFSMHG